jgi:hypothetical protein
MPGARCARSRAWWVVNTRVSHRRPPGSPGIPARNGFNGFFRALPGDRAFLSPSSANRVLSKPGRARKTSADLTPASRRQDHTTSPSAKAPFVCAPRESLTEIRPAINVCARALPRPSHPAPTFVTMANAPLRDGMGIDIDLIWGGGEGKYFCKRGWTGESRSRR